MGVLGSPCERATARGDALLPWARYDEHPVLAGAAHGDSDITPRWGGALRELWLAACTDSVGVDADLCPVGTWRRKETPATCEAPPVATVERFPSTPAPAQVFK